VAAGTRVDSKAEVRAINGGYALPVAGWVSRAQIPLPSGVAPPVLFVDGREPITARLNASHTGFAMMAGGGLDIKLSKHIAFRPWGRTIT
jgi:hypothetical protein